MFSDCINYYLNNPTNLRSYLGIQKNRKCKISIENIAIEAKGLRGKATIPND